MPDNLTIQIAADSSKLRADLKLAESSLKDFNKQLNAAAREAQKTGDRSRVDALSAAYGQQAEVVAALRREYAKLNETTAVTARGTRNMAASVSNLAVELKEALLAFAALEGVRKAVDVFRDVAKEITEVRNTAKAAGMSTAGVQVFTEALRETGESADGARQALVALTDRIAQARVKMAGFRGGVAGVTTLRGGEGKVGIGQEAGIFGGPQALRGGEAALKDVNAIVEKIVDNAAKLQGDKGTRAVLRDINELMKRDPQLGAAVGVEIFGRRWAKIAQTVADLGKPGTWEKINKELEEGGRLIKPEDVKRVDDYNRAVDNVGDAFMKLKMAVAIPLFPSLTEKINEFASLVESFDQIGAKYQQLKETLGLAQLEEALFGPIRRGLNGVIEAIQQWASQLPGFLSTPIQILTQMVKIFVDAITGDLSGAVRDFGNLASTVFNAVISIIQAATSAILWGVNQIKAAYNSVSGLFKSGSPATGAAIPVPVYAAGGMISGRGSGTSDSILARLSNGEFVMRAAAVKYWGPQLLAAMNSGLPRFAEGGMVGGSGARAAVHLHLGGQDFALAGATNVVDALVTAAHRQHVRSAGVKPSWYGGR
jgi:hypothetical protein